MVWEDGGGDPASYLIETKNHVRPATGLSCNSSTAHQRPATARMFFAMETEGLYFLTREAKVISPEPCFFLILSIAASIRTLFSLFTLNSCGSKSES